MFSNAKDLYEIPVGNEDITKYWWGKLKFMSVIFNQYVAISQNGCKITV